jgi:hypothetical protein
VSSSSVNGFVTRGRPVDSTTLAGIALDVASEEDDARGMRWIALDELAIDGIAARIRHAEIEQDVS